MNQHEAMEKLISEVMGVLEQAEKNQWWNVISRLHEAQETASQRFGTVLRDSTLLQDDPRSIHETTRNPR